MYSLNKVQLIGNLTRDPEMRQLPTGVAVASFSVATNQVWNDQNGVRQEKAEFHDIVAWRKLAEIAGQILRKGGKGYVEGKLQTREWTGEDGVKRRKTEIVAENLIALDKRGSGMDRNAAGIGSMLKLNTETIYQSVQQALHTTISTRQSRKGEISSWKAYAPAHAGKLAIEAVDRVMRGEGAPSPIYEGEDSVVARILDGKNAFYKVPLPKKNESKKAMLHRYVSAGAFGRYQSLKNKTNNESFSMDIALPRNEVNWFENLPDEIENSIELKLYYSITCPACGSFHKNVVPKIKRDYVNKKNTKIRFLQRSNLF